MSLASTATAFGCLALGLADLLYLNLAAIPAVFEESSVAAVEPATALEPEPVARQPVARQPVAREPVAPQPVAREPVAPEPVAPEPVAPQPVAREPVARQPVAREPVAREPVAPEPVEPDPTPRRPAPRPAHAERVRVRAARSWSMTVSFARDRDDLSARARAGLDRAAIRLTADPSAAARIDGHTDRVGDSAHNLELSQRRAERVADHLASLGIDRERMTVRGLGERRPLARDDDVDAHRRNRRVEVRVVTAAPDAPAHRPPEEAP